MSEPSFFSIGVDDVERGRVFYEALLGWRMGESPTGGGHTIATPGVPGGLHGGDPQASPYLFFGVDDLDAALGRVRELGGAVDDPEHGGDTTESVERFGRFRLCRDDQGSSFGLHQAPPRGSSGEDDAAVLVGLVDDWARAIVSNDPDLIGGFATDDWVLVSESGITTRDRFLEFVRSGDLSHTQMDRVGEAEVRVFGDAAVVAVRMTNTAYYRGQRIDADEWVTEVFARRDHRWLCCLSHITSTA